MQRDSLNSSDKIRNLESTAEISVPTTANGVNFEQVERPSGQQSTGPRTPEGKQKSKFNALKHGIFSKTIILTGESRAEFQSFRIALRECFQVQGVMEEMLVDNLAVLLWRKARFFRAENAEIMKEIEFLHLDSLRAQRIEAWDCAHWGRVLGGMLRLGDNHFIVEKALEMLDTVRKEVEIHGFLKDSAILTKLYGTDEDGRPYGIAGMYCHLSALSSLVAKDEENTFPAKQETLKKIMLSIIDREQKYLTTHDDKHCALDNRRMKLVIAAAIVPSQKVCERFMRYESHLSREIDRILRQVERFQRTRQGLPIASQIDVSIST